MGRLPRLFAGVSLAALVASAAGACSSTSDDGDPGTPDGSSPDSSTTPGVDTGVPPNPVDSGADTSTTLDAALDGDAEEDAAPADPAVRFVGRADTSDPGKPIFSWPGSRIIARFDGTEASVTLAESAAEVAGPSHWDVLVDGVRTSTLVPTIGMGTYTVASGLAAGTHTVELYKRTEAKVGTTKFHAIAFPGGGTLLAPPPTPTRRIEFLSDSTTTGYGNECTNPNDAFTAATQNERLAYGGLVAKDLAADHHDISISGKGVLVNNYRPDPVVFDQLFPRTQPAVALADWTFASFVPDVVWLMLGANDWDSGEPTPSQPNATAFNAKYDDLVVLVRSKYPNAHFFMAIAPSLNDDYPVGYAARTKMVNAIDAVLAAHPTDTKLYKGTITPAVYPTDLTGCGFHTNLAKHRAMADEVIPQIKLKTGWP